MPTLTDCQKMIVNLANKKNWGSNVGTKIFYGLIELGEAGDIWKHRKDLGYLWKKLGLRHDQIELAIAEELIDTIYYCLHGLFCLNPDINVDILFLQKHKVNEERNRIYADDSTKDEVCEGVGEKQQK